MVAKWSQPFTTALTAVKGGGGWRPTSARQRLLYISTQQDPGDLCNGPRRPLRVSVVVHVSMVVVTVQDNADASHRLPPLNKRVLRAGATLCPTLPRKEKCARSTLGGESYLAWRWRRRARMFSTQISLTSMWLNF